MPFCATRIPLLLAALASVSSEFILDLVNLPRRDTRALTPTLNVRREGAAPLSGAEEQTARAFRAYAMCACLLSLQMGSMN